MKVARIVNVDQIDLDNLMGGGIETNILDLCEISNGDISVIGISRSKESKLGEWKTVNTFSTQVLFLPIAKIYTRLKWLPESLLLCIGLIKNKKKLPDALYIVHRVEVGLFVGAIIKKPYVLFIHNGAEGLLSGNSESVWATFPWLYKLIEAWSIKRAKVTYVFNPRASEELLRKHVNIKRQSNWYSSKFFWNDPRVERRDTYVFCGRLESQKNPTLAIRAFGELLKKQPEAHLVVIGDGSLMKECKALTLSMGLEKRVEFLGNISRAEVANLFRKSRVMVTSSSFEGSPFNILEALACGLPVVATSSADTELLIKDGINGFRSELNNEKSLADLMYRASQLKLDSPEVAGTVQQNSSDKLVAKIFRELKETAKE